MGGALNLHELLIGYVPVAAALLILFVFLKINGKIKRIKAGPLEFEAKDEHIDPAAPCPYTKAYIATRNEIEKVQEKMHEEFIGMRADIKKLGKKIDGLVGEVDTLTTGQLKILFRSAGQPLAERLLAGLQYVHKGQDGDMGKAVIKMASGRMEMYAALCAMKPEYKIPEVEKIKDGGEV